MARAAQPFSFVIPGKRPQAARPGIQFSNVRSCMWLDSGFALSARPGMTSKTFNPSAGGGPVATSGAGGAGASKRQP